MSQQVPSSIFAVWGVTGDRDKFPDVQKKVDIAPGSLSTWIQPRVCYSMAQMADIHSSPMFDPPQQRKPHMSITLPRNFAPNGLEGVHDPKTPDQNLAEFNLPPPPPHSTLRIRRPRLFQSRSNALPSTLFASEIPIPSSALSSQPEVAFASDPICSDVPIPSVESSTLGRPLFLHSQTEPSPSDRLRLPPYRGHPPCTPPAQTKTKPTEFKRSIWDLHRSESEYSIGSDSSLSSSATFTTRPTSFDGSVTSPDLDLSDPFSPSKVNIIPDTPTRRSKKLRLHEGVSRERVQWSIEMDNHLFNVYQMYLADPSVTPFKTVPGSIPPTGVCHRVARRARETWPKASKISRPIVRRYKLRNVFDDRSVRERTPDPNDFLRTDHAIEQREPWPSESSTRKRLKQLCKEKFTITAHYQRLRESRSPSPFTDQFLRRPSSRLTRSKSDQLPDERAAAAYATRELGISLVASGATAPLAQLTTGDSPAPEQQSEDWFNTPINSSSDQMNISPPSGLGINTGQDAGRLSVASNIPRLASPFTYSTWNGSSHSNQHRRHLSQNMFDTMHATGSRLLSPFKPEPDVSSNVNKRRAQHILEDELSPRGSNIAAEVVAAGPSRATQELVFTGVGDLSNRRIKLRGRGATLGAVNNREQIERLFSPPTNQGSNSTGVPPVPSLPPSLTALASANGPAPPSLGLAPPEVDANQKRLGSPFELDPNKRSQRANTPRHVPSLSDPFISSTMNSSMSISERLAEFSNFHRTISRDDPFA